jgi:1-acyl-sn-glycerol-3-phosphate acyltransferase
MIRCFYVAVVMAVVALVLLPFQLAGILLNNRLQRIVPNLFHRAACAVIGIRITQAGERTRESPVLILSNHASWLDIIVLGAIAPVVFVANPKSPTGRCSGNWRSCSARCSSSASAVTRPATPRVP